MAKHSAAIMDATRREKSRAKHEADIRRGLTGCDLHGHILCPCCVKLPGQCDFGSCQEEATGRVMEPATDEARPMCARHAAFKQKYVVRG